MVARASSCAVIGLDGVIVGVEVDTGGGLPYMAIAGLPDVAIQEDSENNGRLIGGLRELPLPTNLIFKPL